MNDIYEKFPPNRKEEFLNWVMLTQPKNKWSDIVHGYIMQLKLVNWKEGLGFIIKYDNYHNYYNSAYYAYLMVDLGYASPRWARNRIENNKKVCDPHFAPLLMVKMGYAPQEWYDKHFGDNSLTNIE